MRQAPASERPSRIDFRIREVSARLSSPAAAQRKGTSSATSAWLGSSIDRIHVGGSEVKRRDLHTRSYASRMLSGAGPAEVGASEPRSEPTTIGIALSGGGVRAAFYSLGVLLYIVRSGLHERVRFVASVSGGSIVNAAIASWTDMSKVSSADFEKFVGRVSLPMATKGVFFWPGWKKVLFGLVVLALWSPLFILIMTIFGIGQGWSWDVFWLGQLLYAVPMTFYFLATLLLGRRTTQTKLFAKLIGEAAGPGRKAPRDARSLKLSDFVESRVRHVLCATELTSGAPVYMDRQMVHSPVYGTGKPEIRVAEAVYASAAFPLGFPPLTVKPTALNMSGGWAEDRPPRLLLSDGGVFNNLASDSFTAWDDIRRSPFITAFGGSLPCDPDQFIVVNASSPAALNSLSRVPGWRSIVAIRRIMSVLYENTVRPRIQAIIRESVGPCGTVVIDIADSPVELASRMRTDDNGIIVERILEALRRSRSDAEWHAYAKRASSTKTVLRPIGVTAAVRLLLVGHLDAAVACQICFGTPGVESVPDEGWFRSLLEGAANNVRPT